MIQESGLAAVITPDVLRGTGEQMLTTFSEMINLCLLAAAVMYAVLFILLTKLVVDKNAHTISLMKIFGYSGKELRSLYLSTTTGVVAFSLVATLPPATAGVSLMYHELMFAKMSGYLEIVTPWRIFAAVIAVGFVCYAAVYMLNMRRVTGIPMEEALKGRE